MCGPCTLLASGGSVSESPQMGAESRQNHELKSESEKNAESIEGAHVHLDRAP